MADYISAYTGEQIDSAVEAVLENSESWDGKPSTEEMNTAISNAVGAVNDILDDINGEVV